MARPIVTATAMRKAQEMAAQSGRGRPVVTVSWERPAHNNVRGSEGETIWLHTVGKWTVSVGTLVVRKDAQLQTTKIGGLEFFFCISDDSPPVDKLTIDYADGEFIVR